MFPPSSGVVSNWRVHTAVCRICGVHEENACVKSRKLKVRCMKMECWHWRPNCPGISWCWFWYFVEFPANSLTNSVMCKTVLLLWQWYRIVWAIQTHFIPPIICTFSNKCSENLFLTVSTSCYHLYALWWMFGLKIRGLEIAWELKGIKFY